MKLKTFIGEAACFLICIGGANLAHANPPTVHGASFSPTSVKLPILEIGLVDPTTGANYAVYSCNATNPASCMLDVANPALLAQFFGAIPEVGATPRPTANPSGAPSTTPTAAPGILPNTYKQLYVRTCQSGTYQLQIMGTVTLNSTTLYTQSSVSDPLTTVQANQGYVTFTVSGCQTNYNIPGGVTVVAGATMTLNLLTNVQNLISAYDLPSSQLGNETPLCAASGNTYTLCYNYPPLVPFLGTGTPTRESYYLTDSGDATGARAYAELDFYLTPQGAIIGAVTRPVLNTSTSVGVSWGGSNTTWQTFASPFGNSCKPDANSSAAACGFTGSPWATTLKNFSLNNDNTTYDLISFSGAPTPPATQFVPTDTTDVDMMIPNFTRIGTVGGTPTAFTATSNRGEFSANLSSNSVVLVGQAVRVQ